MPPQPARKRAVVFVDGQNLYHSVRESFPAKFGRTGFRKLFRFEPAWQERFYATKEVEAIAVREGEDWLVITVVTRYY